MSSTSNRLLGTTSTGGLQALRVHNAEFRRQYKARVGLRHSNVLEICELLRDGTIVADILCYKSFYCGSEVEERKRFLAENLGSLHIYPTP